MCTELNTLFFCGTAVPDVGKLRMITKPSGLLVFPNSFSVQKEKDQKKKFHPTEAIARIKEVSDFMENCEVEVRQVAGEQACDRILQGPDGVCSVQTRRDIKLTIQTLERISSTLEEISLLLLGSLDLKTLATLVVENLSVCRDETGKRNAGGFTVCPSLFLCK